MPWDTINGIDIVLLIGGLIGWFLYIAERRAFEGHLDMLDDMLEDDREGIEYADPGVRIVCGTSTHWEHVQAFTGRGKPLVEVVQRLNPPTAEEEICRLDVGHEGPHMSTSAVWT